MCSEWLVNQHRDSFASFIGHHDMVSYFALVENESKARIKFNLMQVKCLLCGEVWDDIILLLKVDTPLYSAVIVIIWCYEKTIIITYQCYIVHLE